MTKEKQEIIQVYRDSLETEQRILTEGSMPEMVLNSEYRDQPYSRNYNQASQPSKILYTDSLDPRESTHKHFGIILKTEGESEIDFKNIKTSPDIVDRISVQYK